MSLTYIPLLIFPHLVWPATRPRVVSGRTCFVGYVIRIGLAIRMALGRIEIAVFRLHIMKKKFPSQIPRKQKKKKTHT